MQEVARWDVALLDGNGNIVDMSLPETLWEVLSLSLSWRYKDCKKDAKRIDSLLVVLAWLCTINAATMAKESRPFG